MKVAKGNCYQYLVLGNLENIQELETDKYLKIIELRQEIDNILRDVEEKKKKILKDYQVDTNNPRYYETDAFKKAEPIILKLLEEEVELVNTNFLSDEDIKKILPKKTKLDIVVGIRDILVIK